MSSQIHKSKNKRLYCVLCNLSIILFVSSNIVYGFQSQFINPLHKYEAKLLNQQNTLSDIECALIASGIKPTYYEKYKAEIIQWRFDIESSLHTGDSQKTIASTIGHYLHHNVFSQYKLEATTLKEVFETGSFNCLSATILMNILLRSFNIVAKTIILPTHVYTSAWLDGCITEIENTIKDGLSISQNHTIQQKFNQLTGFDYNSNNTQRVTIDWYETIGLLYSNRSYFNAQKSQHCAAFQNMLKAQVFLSHVTSEHKNLIAGYLNYSYHIYRDQTKSLETHLKTLSILEEGMLRFPKYHNLQGNYIKGLDMVIEKMIAARAHPNDIDILLGPAKHYLQKSDFNKLEKNRYIRSIKQFLDIDKDYSLAKRDISKLWGLYPKDKNVHDMIKKYSWKLVKQEVDTKQLKENPRLLMSLSEFPCSLTMEPLEYYYATLAKHNFEIKNYEYAVEIMKEGQKKTGTAPIITQNGFAYATHSAEHYIKTKQFSKALEFYEYALFFKNNKNTIHNIETLCVNLIHDYILQHQENKAKQLLKKGLSILPNNIRLNNLKTQLQL